MIEYEREFYPVLTVDPNTVEDEEKAMKFITSND
jgi:hypothetical protein